MTKPTIEENGKITQTKVGGIYLVRVEDDSVEDRNVKDIPEEQLRYEATPSHYYDGSKQLIHDSTHPPESSSSSSSTSSQVLDLSSPDYSWRDRPSSAMQGFPSMRTLDIINTAAVFDIKWSSFLYKDVHSSGIHLSPVFASALSDGTVSVYTTSHENIRLLQSFHVADCAVLSLDWGDRQVLRKSPSLGVSTSSDHHAEGKSVGPSSLIDYSCYLNSRSVSKGRKGKQRTMKHWSGNEITLNPLMDDEAGSIHGPNDSAADGSVPEVYPVGGGDDEEEEADDGDLEGTEMAGQCDLVASFEDGSVALLNLSSLLSSANRSGVSSSNDDVDHNSKESVCNIGMEVVSRWQAHDLEAWVATMDEYDRHVIYTGADDSLLKVWDSRMIPVLPPDWCEHDGIPVASSVRLVRGHDAGVCSIQTNPFNEHVIATGSYDEYLRIWDKRNWKSPLGSLRLGGGAWRVKWYPAYPSSNKDNESVTQNDQMKNLILVSAMHGGVHVIDTRVIPSSCSTLTSPDPVTCTPISLAEYHSHGPTTLAYGADWGQIGRNDLCRQTSSTGHQNKHFSSFINNCLIASCSFYNHRLDLWSPHLASLNPTTT